MARRVNYLTKSTARIYSNPMDNPFTAGVAQRTSDPNSPVPLSPLAPTGNNLTNVGMGGMTDPFAGASSGGMKTLGIGTYESPGLTKWGDKYADFFVTSALKDNPNTYGKNAGEFAPKGTAKANSGAGKVVNAAQSYEGQNRYVYGVFDCSKYVQEVAAKAGESIPRTCATQYNYFKTKRRLVGQNEAKAGDLIFMGSKASPSGWHVGIYLGNGMMIDNAGRGKPIKARSIKGRNIKGFGRLSIK